MPSETEKKTLNLYDRWVADEDARQDVLKVMENEIKRMRSYPHSNILGKSENVGITASNGVRLWIISMLILEILIAGGLWLWLRVW